MEELTPPVVTQNTQPVFYSLSAEPEVIKSTPWFKKRQLVVMGVSALILVALVAVVAVLSMNIMQGNKQAKQLADSKAAQVSQMVANGSSPTTASREAGYVEGCKMLVDTAYADCVTLIAMDKDDSSVCGALAGDEKVTCVDRSTIGQAKAKKSYAACSAIKDADLLVACQVVLKTEAAAAQDCAGYGAPVEACDAQKSLDLVVAAGDITACGTLPGEDKESCEDIISSVDADGDGLTIQAEFTHGTTDTKADTDGDGYNDGEEVANGHDPLKK